MSDDKTELPTPQRLRKAREDGQVARSADFAGAVVVLATGASVWVLGSYTAHLLLGFFQRTAQGVGARKLPVFGVLEDAALVFLQVTGPVLAVALGVGGFVAYAQVGAAFHVKGVLPDGSRLNPAQGIKNVISKRKLVDLGKNLLKLGAMTLVALSSISDVVPVLARLPQLPLSASVSWSLELVASLCLRLVVVLTLLGILDLVLQRRRHTKDLMMSKQEVKDEHKQAEGDPHVRAQRKRLHQQLLQGGTKNRVRQADAVVVNPTHIAVALQYDADTMDEPEIVARGMGEQARAIRREAQKYGVPVVQNVDLARALYQADDGIPAEMYEAVAEVLHYVYSLRKEG